MNNGVTLELGQPYRMIIHHNLDEHRWRVTQTDACEKTMGESIIRWLRGR